MNRSFQPTSALLRSVFAAAAVLATLVVAGGIEGLIARYDTESQLANAQLNRLAQR
jgi:outer membrane murein-binding lipoprotein Lpp